MARQGTANIGLTYEDDKSKTFSYDNDIKNNMITTDSEIGSAKNRLSDIENNTESPQFTPLLAQDSSIFSAGSGRDEIGVEVDESDGIVKGQVNIESIKGRTVTNLLGSEGEFETDSDSDGLADGWFGVSGNSSLVDGWTGKTQSFRSDGVTTNYFYIGNNISLDKFNPLSHYVILGDIKLLNVENIDTIKKVKLTPNNGATFHTSCVYLFPDLTKLNTIQIIGTKYKTIGNISGNAQHIAIAYSNGTASPNTEFQIDNVRVIEITQEEYDTLSVEQLADKYPYINNTKSTVSALRLKSVGKNLFDISKAEIGSLGTTTGADSNNGFPQAFRSKFIRVKPNTNYYVSGLDATALSWVFLYDSNKNFLSRTGHNPQSFISLTTSSNTCYIRLAHDVFATEKDRDNALNSLPIQIEENTISTSFEEYKESMAYIYDGDGMGNVVEVHSMGDIYDEILDGKLYKKINKATFDFSTAVWGSNTSGVNIDKYWVLSKSLPSDALGGSIADGDFLVDDTGYKWIKGDSSDNVNNIGKYYYDSSNVFIFVVAKDTGSPSFSSASCTYQLSPNKKININTTPLTCYPKGTITIEPFMYKKFSYNNGITWTTPVIKIEEIKKISTGEIITDYTLSSDGLSLTISNASNGEEYTVKAPIRREESTIPTTVMSYPTNINAANKTNADAINELSKMVSELLVKQWV